jgi:hypothetical protein
MKKNPSRGSALLLCAAALTLFSCENPMVNHLLGAEDTEDKSVVALWNGVWYNSLKEAVDAAGAAGPWTAVSPALIHIRRTVGSPRTLGANGLTLTAGLHISLEPYTPEVPAVTIKRWGGNTAALFTIETGASLTLAAPLMISGGGHAGTAVYVKTGGAFYLSGSARVSVDNDVFLEGDGSSPGATVSVSGILGASPVARLTPQKYPDVTHDIAGVNAVLAADISANCEKFDVSPQSMAGWVSPREWRIDTQGKFYYVGVRTSASGVTKYYETLQESLLYVSGLDADNPADITIISNFDFDAADQIAIALGKYIRLIVDPGYSYTLRRKASATNYMFSVSSGASLELGSPEGGQLILDGGAVWGSDGTGTPSGGAANSGVVSFSHALVSVHSWGVFTLSPGAILRNNDRTSGKGGGVECHGQFTMKGGVITRNRAPSGGGIFFGANTSEWVTRTITGGEITNNCAGSTGGAIVLDTLGDCTLIMTGGLIRGNKAGSVPVADTMISPTMGFGGGVFIPGYSGNKFDMRGGLIDGNISANGLGNGVAMDRIWFPDPVFNLSGSARIEGNDVQLHKYLSANDCVITVTGPMTTVSPVHITTDAPTIPGVGIQVLGGSFNLSKFTAAPHSLGGDGKMYP